MSEGARRRFVFGDRVAVNLRLEFPVYRNGLPHQNRDGSAAMATRTYPERATIVGFPDQGGVLLELDKPTQDGYSTICLMESDCVDLTRYDESKL